MPKTIADLVREAVTVEYRAFTNRYHVFLKGENNERFPGPPPTGIFRLESKNPGDLEPIAEIIRADLAAIIHEALTLADESKTPNDPL
jgi:hypothetical protein